MVSILNPVMLRQALDNLDPVQRRQLMYAFEQEIAQYIELDGGIFIGVNVDVLNNLEIEEQSGVWAYGRIK